MLKKLQSQMNQLPLTYRENSEMKDNTKRIEIYTDGACIGNPGPGGWGAIIINQNEDNFSAAIVRRIDQGRNKSILYSRH